MPPDRFAYDHPHHDTHGGSIIHDNDEHALDLGKPHIFGDFPAAFAHVNDEPADVTVSDLLDAHTNRDYYPGGSPEYNDLYQRASTPVIHSHWRILDAIEAASAYRELLARLSPEERAEFDHRTT